VLLYSFLSFEAFKNIYPLRIIKMVIEDGQDIRDFIHRFGCPLDYLRAERML